MGLITVACQEPLGNAGMPAHITNVSRLPDVYHIPVVVQGPVAGKDLAAVLTCDFAARLRLNVVRFQHVYGIEEDGHVLVADVAVLLHMHMLPMALDG